MNNNQLLSSFKLFLLTVVGLCIFSTASFAQSCSYTGSFNSNYGKMKLTQSGKEVVGTYGSNGHISGAIEGGILYANWWSGSYYVPGPNGGEVDFYMSPDCSKIAGDWRDGDQFSGYNWDRGKWNATRIYQKPKPPSYPPPSTVQRSGGYGLPTYSNKSSGSYNNKATYNVLCNWDGYWNAANGRMYLEQTGPNTVEGRYDRKSGVIKGTISGNLLSGTWAQMPSYKASKDAGQIVLTISPDCNSFTGKWRYGYNHHYNKWNTGWNATRAR